MRYQSDIVALSCLAAFNPQDLCQRVGMLVTLLPDTVQIWLGGARPNRQAMVMRGFW